MDRKQMGLIAAFIFFLGLLPAAFVSAEGPQSKIEIAVNTANVRSEPSMSASVVGQAARGTRYEVLKEKYDWYQIQLEDGQKGWIAGYIVKKADSSSQTAQQTVVKNASSGKPAAVIADNLNVRSEPSLSANVIGKLNIGDQVSVTESKNGWVHIRYKGQEAWISEQFVRMITKTNSSAANSKTVADGFAVILYNGTNLRSDASRSSSIVARGSQGERYPIHARVGDWYEIRLASGQQAYVASWVVSVNGEASSQASASRTPGLQGKTIILDPGHGGIDGGTTGMQGTFEKFITLKTADRLYHKLKQAGANVILTRSDDRYVSLPSRVATAKYHRADAFISLHYDSTYHSGANGFTTYYYHNNHKELANNVNRKLSQSLPIKNRGVRHGDYFVLRENNQPAILLELGYLSNPQEELTVVTNPYQELITNGVYNGLKSYFNE
ncbi:N-acetylmuramoyl-L-alanine amidase [Bacillus sp. B190/17]|uniref:N-acetylmuramoyl-L-alanine amidase n=1 Tax=Bacillus lumedeiriae TaxID=3058829 RepID=A0ABW8I4X2_9BACI